MATAPNLLEILTKPIYDSGTIAAATSNQEISLFRAQRGTGTTTWGAAGAKTFEDTNIEQGGQLPTKNRFELFTLQIIPDLRATFTTVKNALFGGVLRFFVADFPRFECPVHALPAGCGMHGGVATTVAATTPDVSAFGLPSPQAVFTLRDPIVIDPQESFFATLFIGDGSGIAVALKFRLLCQGRYTRGA